MAFSVATFDPAFPEKNLTCHRIQGMLSYPDGRICVGTTSESAASTGRSLAASWRCSPSGMGKGLDGQRPLICSKIPSGPPLKTIDMTYWEEISLILSRSQATTLPSTPVMIGECHELFCSADYLRWVWRQTSSASQLLKMWGRAPVASFLNGPLAISPSLLGAKIYGKPGFEDPHITSYYGFLSELPVVLVAST